MELKIKFLRWTAGLPVAMLNKNTAAKVGVHAKGRITIKIASKKHSKEVHTIVDIVEGLVSYDQIAVTSEIKQILDLRAGQRVEVNISESPESLNFIKKKLNNKTLSKKEIGSIIKDISNNALSEAEIALFISAMYEQGMNLKETIYLIDGIIEFGSVLKLKNKLIVDKHSTGGIPGNRTTPLVVSICAAAGLVMPKTSSRAITSAAGTADVIESIAKVDFSIPEIKKIIKKTNACMVWGGGLGMVPADSKIIKIERALKIDPVAQLLASIISKKLAVGSKYILIDIPYGKGAKVPHSKAVELKKKFEVLARHYKKKMKVVLTNGSQPIGNGIGPVLELIDIIKILDPMNKGPKDLKDKALFLAGEIFEMVGKTKRGQGVKLAREILDSGKAFEKFKQIIAAQKGCMKCLIPAKFEKSIPAKRSGKIIGINNHNIASLARAAGCPADKSSGLYLFFHVGERVKKGDKLFTIYSESKSRLEEAMKFYSKNEIFKIKN